MHPVSGPEIVTGAARDARAVPGDGACGMRRVMHETSRSMLWDCIYLTDSELNDNIVVDSYGLHVLEHSLLLFRKFLQPDTVPIIQTGFTYVVLGLWRTPEQHLYA